jgi:hypothetical protein
MLLGPLLTGAAVPPKRATRPPDPPAAADDPPTSTAAAHDIPLEDLYVLPETLKYREGEAPPMFYRLGKRRRRPMWIAGTAILAGGHALHATSSLAGGYGRPAEIRNFIPCIGPFTPTDKRLGSELGRVTVGMIQIAGCLVLPIGLFQRRVWVREDLPLVALPTAGDRPGLSVLGRF